MNLRPISFFVVLAAFVVAAAFGAAPASAQPQLPPCGTPHCGPFSEDPGEPCLGTNDPFCNGGGGGGGTPGCDRCMYYEAFPGAGKNWGCCSATSCSTAAGNGWTITQIKFAAGTCQANNHPSSNCTGDPCLTP